MTAGKIKVTEAAALLHVSDQFVRIGMQRGILPIGTALKMSTKWTYQISEKLLDVYNVFMQEPGNTENARELRQRIEKLEQQNRNLANDLQQQRETMLEQEEEYSKETVIWRETEESLQEQVRTATEQLEESKLEIVRLKAEIYDILSKNGDI